MGGGAVLGADADWLGLGDEPTRAVEAVEGQRVLELAVRAGARQHPAVGRRHHGGAVEEADELLAQVVERAPREDDLDEDAVHFLEPVEDGGLVVEHRTEDLGVEAVARGGIMKQQQGQARPIGALAPRPRLALLDAGDGQGGGAGSGQVIEQPGLAQQRGGRL